MVSSSVTPLACIADLDCDEIIRKRYFLKKQDCFGVKALVTFTKQLQTCLNSSRLFAGSFTSVLSQDILADANKRQYVTEN